MNAQEYQTIWEAYINGNISWSSKQVKKLSKIQLLDFINNGTAFMSLMDSLNTTNKLLTMV